MAKRPYSKRTRAIHSCSECHRRKQKCDRQKPCNICSSRNIPEKCLYGDVNVKTTSDYEVDLSSLSPRLSSRQRNETETMSDLLNEMGYAAENEHTSFVNLQKSLNNGVKGPVPSPNASKLQLARHLTERYYNLVQHLPSDSITTSLVDVYFTEANWWFMVLERYYFTRLFQLWLDTGAKSVKHRNIQSLSRDLQYFPGLLFQVIAVALQFLPANHPLQHHKNQDLELESQKYSRMGVEIINLLGNQNCTITSVEFGLMRCLWLKNCSRGNEAWYTLGNTIRQAQNVGLHLEPDFSQDPRTSVQSNLLRMWDNERRRRLWSRLFVYDSHMALKLGRPRGINREDCPIHAPIDCDIPDEPSNTIPMLPNKNQAPSSYTAQVFLYQIGHRIHDMFSSGAGRASIREYGHVRDLHDQVLRLVEELPPAMRSGNPDKTWDHCRPHFSKFRQYIVTVTNAFIMGLHRPYIATHEASRVAAIEAALNILDSQQQLFDLMSEHHYKIYGFSFYSIDAGILLSAIAIRQVSDDPETMIKIRDSLQKAIGRLALLKNRSQVAKSGEYILSRCYTKVKELAFQQEQKTRVDNLQNSHSLEKGSLMDDFPNFMFDLDSDDHVYDIYHNLVDAGRYTAEGPDQFSMADIFSYGPDFDALAFMDTTGPFLDTQANERTNNSGLDFPP